MLDTKTIFFDACNKSEELHQMNDEERNQLQSHLCRMYIEIERVCDKHGLRMMVAYGTALGALRHKGFIPWDDDMDLLMPREDYDKLINLYADELPRRYKIYAPNSKNGPIYRFAKVVDTSTRFLGPESDDSEKNGIFVDIFALENSPSNLIVVELRRLLACSLEVIASCVNEIGVDSKFYRKLMCSIPKGKLIYSIRHFLGVIFSFKNAVWWFNCVDKFLHYKKDTGYYSVPTGDGGKWRYFQPFPKDLYLPVKRMKFNEIEVYVPNKVERHCEIEYGDWHIIPPVDERWQHFVKEIRF